MSEPFIGEIRAWALGFVPQGWLPCDGRQLSIAEYQALYAVIGPTYGGDSRNYFKLPNLQGYAPMGTGAPKAQWQPPPNAVNVTLGETMGQNAVTLTPSNMPNHNHQAVGAFVGNSTLMTATPTATTYVSRTAKPATTGALSFSAWSNLPTSNSQMDDSMIQLAGGGQAHENRQPYLVLNFYIAWDGVFPVSN